MESKPSIKPPILHRFFSTDTPANVPPLPAVLLWGLLIARFGSGVAQVGLAYSLWTRPDNASASASAFQRWMSDGMAINLHTFGNVLFLTGLLSIVIHIMPRFTQLPLVRLLLYLFLTLPLVGYVALTNYFVLLVEPGRSTAAVVLYTSLLCNMFAAGAISIGLWAWITQVRIDGWKKRRDE